MAFLIIDFSGFLVFSSVIFFIHEQIFVCVCVFFLSFNQQSEYKVFYKLMCWLGGSLTFRLPNVMRSSPARRSRKFSNDWCLAPRRWGFYNTHSEAPQSIGLLWTSGQLVVETSTWKHTTLTTDRHPCPRWDSNPRSQQASGRRLTP